MLVETELLEHGAGVDIENVRRRLVGIKPHQDRDQAAHDMSVAVAAEMEEGAPVRVRAELVHQPDLADAARHLVFRRMLGLAQGLEFLAEFDYVAVPLLPLIEKGEVVYEVQNAHVQDIATWGRKDKRPTAGEAAGRGCPPARLGTRRRSRQKR